MYINVVHECALGKYTMYLCMCTYVHECVYIYVCVCVCVCVCVYRLFHQFHHVAIELDVLQLHKQRSIVLRYHKRKPCELRRCLQPHTVPTSVSMNIAAQAANLAISIGFMSNI